MKNKPLPEKHNNEHPTVTELPKVCTERQGRVATALLLSAGGISNQAPCVHPVDKIRVEDVVGSKPATLRGELGS